MNELLRIFNDNRSGKKSMRWTHYLEVYDKYFAHLRGQEVNILEIGVFHGGSIDIWLEYFGEKCRYYGVDINPNCKNFEKENVQIFIGSQDDKTFLEKLKSETPKMDIIIDDGGHMMRQQKLSFDILFSHLKSIGFYSCEDTHTSYFRSYGGGLRKSSTFIEFSKRQIDQLYAWRSPRLKIDYFTKNCFGIHYYNGIVLYEKRELSKPEAINSGLAEVSPFKMQRTPRSIYNKLYSKVTYFIYGN